MPDGSATPSPVPGRGALVTGAGGFIGRGLVRALQARNVEVRGFELPDRSDRHSRPADLTEPETARAAITAATTALGTGATVFHLAGIANAGVCRVDPAAAFRANVVATANVLEACRQVGLRRIVFPSTALVYVRESSVPIGEDAAVCGRSIYAATKLAAEALLAGYSGEYGFSVDIARLGNVYGPGAPHDSVVGTLLRQVAGDGRVRLKTLAPVRDFIHRDDVAEGLIRLMEAGDEPGVRIVNLSSGVATSIGALADLAAEAVSSPFSAVELDPGTGRDDRLVLDVGRLRHRTGWVPTRPLVEGLRETLRMNGEQQE